MPLPLESLLAPFGFDPTVKMKLVRHRDKQYDIATIRSTGHFDFYQAVQRRKVFERCDAIISFIGTTGTHALLTGIYRVNGVSQPPLITLPASFPFPQMKTANCYLYELERLPGFSELEGRLVIEWGPGVIKWVQNYRVASKSVVELLPPGYVTHFPGYMNVVLPFAELTSIVTNPVSHRDWHKMLSSVAAVYLILDTKSGDQYIGSASGKEGLLARWRTYVRSPDGGNVKLRNLLKTRPDAYKGFQFSILQTLPTTLTRPEVVAAEVFHKRKLGTRAHGLNSN